MTTALVTGASRGIGRAICLRLARGGYDIVAVARASDDLARLGRDIAALGRVSRVVPMDLTDAGAIAHELQGMDVDVLVNNAGIGVMKPFVDLTADEWHRMIDLNVNSLYHMTRAVLPAMLARGAGHVCTIGSVGGRSAFVGGSCYNATKAFVTSWAESLMLEVRDQGVKVSVIMPGGTVTEFGGKVPTSADDWKLTADDVADAVAYTLATPPKVLIHRLEVRTLNSPPKSR